jgi:hypothetical protein
VDLVKDKEVADESSSHSEADEGRSTMVLYSLAQDKQPIAGQAQVGSHS